MAKLKVKDSNYNQDVRNQYENYPFPDRNPEEEKDRLRTIKMEILDCLNYYCFSGKETFGEDFKVLIAGGGTGDSVIFMAEQLRKTGAQVTYLDISQASMDVARARAKIRKLDNINWIQGSILDLPKLDLGKFNYINCTGVLHHLESTEEGLGVLTESLEDDGAMLIMLYATYGKMAVYQIRELMSIINQNEEDIQIKINNCKRVLESLPDTNWFKSPDQKFGELNLFDNIDVGIYDMFLHSIDRSFTVPEVYELLEGQNLKMIHLDSVDNKYGKNIYMPETYIKDTNLLNKIKKLPLADQHAIGELVNGKIINHMFYTAKTQREVPSVKNLEMVPVFNSYFKSGINKDFVKLIEEKPIGGLIEIKATAFIASFIRKKYTSNIFSYINGKNSLREIFEAIRSDFDPKASYDDLQAEFEYIFNTLNLADWMFLKTKEAGEFESLIDLRQRVADMYSGSGN